MKPALLLIDYVSLPSRERGLKPSAYLGKTSQIVAPLAGAWIETRGQSSAHGSSMVAPLAGAWIETLFS